MTARSIPSGVPARVIGSGWPEPLSKPTIATGDDPVATLATTEFAGLAVPAALSGGGASLREVAGAQRQLARVHPAAAIALNMHSLSVGLMAEHWQTHRDESWMLLESIAVGGHLVASAFAEPGPRKLNFLEATTCVVTPAEGGYVLNGTKFPCSLARHARLFCVNALDPASRKQVIGLCPSNSEGLSIGDDWTSIGMRDSDTASVTFRDVFLDDRLVFLNSELALLDPLVAKGLLWFSVLVAATYHGVMTELVDLAAGGVDTSSTSAVSRFAIAQSQLFQLGAACLSAAALQHCPDPRVLLATASALRIAATSTADGLVETIRPSLGAAAYTAGAPASSLLLDLLAIHHHPPASDMAASLALRAVVDACPSAVR